MAEETTSVPASEPVETVEARAVRAQAFLDGLFARLGVEARVEVRPTAEALVGRVTVTGGANAAVFADPKSAVWEAIAYLLRKVVNRDPAGRVWVTLERGMALPAPVEAPDEMLVRFGRELAEKAVLLGKLIAVGPMKGADRKWIAAGIAQVEGVSCRSDPDPGSRRLTIVPAVRAPEPPPGA